MVQTVVRCCSTSSKSCKCSRLSCLSASLPLCSLALTFYDCRGQFWLWPSILIKPALPFYPFLKLTKMALKPDLIPCLRSMKAFSFSQFANICISLCVHAHQVVSHTVRNHEKRSGNLFTCTAITCLL